MQTRQPLAHLLLATLLSLAAVATAHAADPAAGGATQAPAGASYVDDSMITAKVKAALIEDKQISSLKINVTTEQGVVKISGTVPNAEVGQRALELAARVEGVKNVQNDLKVKG